MKKLKQKIITFITFFTVTTLLPIHVFAIENINNIEIHGPHKTEKLLYNANKGEEIHDKITIFNGGKQTSKLRFYTHQAEINNSNYELISDQTNKDLSDWIILDKTTLTLKPGETQTLSFKIKIPEQAGIGQHAAAIMASQYLNDSGINLDTGIRIIANIKGEKPYTKYKLINSRQYEENNNFIYETTLVNKGNTDLKGHIKIKDLTDKSAQPEIKEIKLQPKKEEKIILNTKNKLIGAEHIVGEFDLNGELKTFVLKNDFRLPINELLYLGIFCSFIWLTLLSSKLCKNEIKCKTCQKKHIAILLIITFTTIAVSNNFPINNKVLQTNIFGTEKQAYLTTIKWGDFTGNFNEKTQKNEKINVWEGQFTIQNGRIDEVEKLHVENSDKIYVNSDHNAINFQNSTGPDNDGIIVLVRADKKEDMVLTMYNKFLDEEVKIPLAKTLKNPRTYHYKNRQIQIKSELASSNLIEQIDKKIENTISNKIIPLKIPTDKEELTPIFEFESTNDNTLIKDFESSEDNKAYESIIQNESLDSMLSHETDIKPNLLEEIKLLTGLIRELPASPDILSEHILNSEFVSSITSDNNTTTITGSSKLITTLKETPLIIKEITATPDTNFLFLPNDKIKLSNQIFSFEEGRSSEQEMNRMIFVHKTQNPWAVYFSISDLNSASENGSISAKNITFTPGEINIIGNPNTAIQINAGSERKITNTNDLIKIFEVTPQTNSSPESNDSNEIISTIFSIKPKLNIFIPPQTLPGLYRGEITYKII